MNKTIERVLSGGSGHQDQDQISREMEIMETRFEPFFVRFRTAVSFSPPIIRGGIRPVFRPRFNAGYLEIKGGREIGGWYTYVPVYVSENDSGIEDENRRAQCAGWKSHAEKNIIEAFEAIFRADGDARKPISPALFVSPLPLY